MGPPENPLEVVGAWLLTAWFGGAFAMFLGSLAERSETIEKLWHPVAYLLFPLSGAAYLVDALPKSFQNAALWLPMVNGAEMVREGYFGSTDHRPLRRHLSCHLQYGADAICLGA